MSEPLTAEGALALVGSIRDLRVQLELQTGVLLEVRRELKELRGGIKAHADRVMCLDDGLGRASDLLHSLLRPDVGKGGES